MNLINNRMPCHMVPEKNTGAPCRSARGRYAWELAEACGRGRGVLADLGIGSEGLGLF